MSMVEVYPNKKGEWRWHRRDGESTSDRSGAFDNRRDAIQAASDGRDKSEAVVLLRPDGSVYGELFHAEGGDGQSKTLEPVGEANR